jgi:hypothetical protein
MSFNSLTKTLMTIDAINWTQVLTALRSASGLMVTQGLLWGLISDSAAVVLWAKASVLLGMLFWAALEFARQWAMCRTDGHQQTSH